MDERIENLARHIRYYQDKYYNAQPEISDAEFDELWDELKAIAPEHELFSHIGEDGAPAFSKRDHLMPMGSQEKASSEDEFLRWAKRINHPRYIVQYKLDGASIELQYADGGLQFGVTRGDGLKGDDITRNVRKMRGVPLQIDEPFTGAVRGEVIMEHQIHQRYYSDKANCRNAANGLMKRKDGVGSEHLRILCYDAHSTGDTRAFTHEEEKLEWLTAMGFDIVPYSVFDRPEDIVHHRDLVSEIRPSLDYDIDGLVVKGPSIDHADMQRPRPQRQIAYKFSAQEGVTVLRDVEWSESGHLYTPVAIVDPVQLAGTTVRRASLVHPELIAEMGLKIGSEVIITKRGDIIPKIERRVRDIGDTQEISPPTHCGTCGTPVVNEGKRVYCPNLRCKRRDFHRLQKWITVLDIRDFGDVLLRKLFDGGYVREIADLYRLEWETIASFEGMGEVSARKAIENLRAITTVPLPTFVAGFDIGGVAVLKIQRVVDAGFDTLDRLRTASIDDLSAAEGIAEKTAEQIVTGIAAVSEQMERLLSTGAVEVAPPKRGGAEGDEQREPLKGLTFCFTGALQSLTRSEAETIVRRYGGDARSSVSKNLSYLVTNEPESGSSKLKKAWSLGIPIISEEDFQEMISSL